MSSSGWSGRVAIVAVALAGVLAGRTVWAREYESSVAVESLEDLYELQRSGEVDESTVDILAVLLQSPVNLNRADRYVLFDLPGVTYPLADAIVAWRSEHGLFAAKEDLAFVPGMSRELLATLLPFVTVTDHGPSAMAPGLAATGQAELGSIWRRGFGRVRTGIDELAERETDWPQSFLAGEVDALDFMGAGALLTFRRRTVAHWDVARGQLVSEGPTDRPDLDSLYLYAERPSWRAVLGSYTVGFGERLTFDSSGRRDASGWFSNRAITEDNDRGKLRPKTGQFGAAASVPQLNLPVGWMSGTIFGSWARYDLYQYDFRYGLDAYHGANVCTTDGDCPAEYTCGDDHRCYSSKIFDVGDAQQASYRWETLAHAFDEGLAGANVSYHLDDMTQLGVTGYQAETRFRVASDAQPEFSASAAYPQEKRFGAVGVDGRWGRSWLELSGEYSRSQGGGNGAFVRAIAHLSDRTELTVAGRYYDPWFDNPHGRGEADRDELLGLAARNERGVRLSLVAHPMANARWVSDVDVWDNPWRAEYDQSHRLSFASKRDSSVDLLLRQRLDYGRTQGEQVGLLLEYKNKDVSHNSRAETYEAGDWCEEDEVAASSSCGRGERRKAQVRVGTGRIPGMRIWTSYTVAWQDVARLEKRFDVEQWVRLHVSAGWWDGGRLAAHVSYWLHQVNQGTQATSARALVVSDRDEPRLDSYGEVSQRLGDSLTVWVRYGVIHFEDARPERFAWYHLGKLDLEARF